MMRKELILLVFLSLCISDLTAQKFRYSIPGLDTLQQNFIVGGGASTVLNTGQSEFILNNALSSYWLAIHSSGDDSPVLDRLRNTFFATDLFAFFGLSQSGKIDAGVQLRYARTRLDNAAASSPFKVFEKTEEDPIFRAPTDDGQFIADSSFGGISQLGLRLRFKPIMRLPQLVINGGVSISMVRNERFRKQLDASSDAFDLGATYYHRVTSRVYYFLGGTMQVLFPNLRDQKTQYQSSLNMFLVQRSRNQKLAFLPGLNYNIRFRKSVFDEHAIIKSSDFLFAMLGIQYSINQDIILFGFGGFPLIANSVPPQIEIVRNSYSLITFGIRGAF